MKEGKCPVSNHSKVQTPQTIRTAIDSPLLLSLSLPGTARSSSRSSSAAAAARLRLELLKTSLADLSYPPAHERAWLLVDCPAANTWVLGDSSHAYLVEFCVIHGLREEQEECEEEVVEKGGGMGVTGGGGVW